MNYYLINGQLYDSSELYHHGIKGMKWGVRRYQNSDGSLTAAGKKKLSYRSTSIKSALAKRSNDKVDKSFKKWNENVTKRDNAIELGKKANAAKRIYDNDPTKENKAAYRQANKDYKKALSSNTTYRKGVVRQEVGKDAARKYLSDAKKVKKQLTADPSNKALQKKYSDLMSKHDVERANARRATEVSAKRSRKQAALKRNMTMSVKAVAGTAAVAAGAYAANRYLSNHNVTLNGKILSLSNQAVSNVVDLAKKGRNLMNYIY